MSYISEIFERLDLQQIREFLLNGVECLKVSEDSYERRLETSTKFILESIDKRIFEKDIADEMADDVHHHASVNGDIYMEIGMRCGAILVMNLLTVPPKKIKYVRYALMRAA